MNRTEAKAYALNELGLDRDQVRRFGNLSRTQTWLDAIAAQAAVDPGDQPAEPDPVPVPLADLSFEAFWESPDMTLNSQPLTSISELDEDWDDIPEPTPSREPVGLYPIIIALLMLWALLQLLLLLGRWIGLGLTALANALDDAAMRRLDIQLTPPEHPANHQEATVWIPASS